ncbi:Squamosa promoter-binding-like protein 9 [Acorus gramineus]|uniref:Squamosa promoter-binding-like protein 9 n=1 Tax=Acorus gramineus TaxID=55184 RepID=A0AAV9BRN7_ACOGR|nr:Squamosa promoter-binding-like protein 9 [Acorus gramineus]
MENPQTTPSTTTTTTTTTTVEETTSAIWDWETLLDFPIPAQEEDPLFIFPWPDVDPPPPTPPEPPSDPRPSSNPVSAVSDRVQKRDPRLTCANFLAGRVPCSCPEEDLEAVAAASGGGILKKRARKGTAGAGRSNVRCQVPGCEADISELKGYHRRHHVCLTCANAESVILDGVHMRYCQQCGKFHILQDFDQDKRSCRRKLERHNKRRRRRSTRISNVVEKEKEVDLPIEDITCPGETDKDSPCPGNKDIDTVVLLESDDDHGSPICLIPSVRNVKSAASFEDYGEIRKEGADLSKLTMISSFADDKTGYSSMCPTGRLSFKLYDWNPAEFPRRLRHQIFQWLASMPVELEGYIRPGCIILTVFIAMPCFMWDKLSRHAAEYLNDFIHGPESVLSGRGAVLIYLNNMIYEVLEDGTSLMNIRMDVQVPRLHYVYPTVFEAGKPMEFIACGSNLSHPKFQFLVSFAGKYLPCNFSLAAPHGKESQTYPCSEEESFGSFEHEIFKIHVPHTEAKLLGPAFIEIENEYGLSNFIPVLVGDKPSCAEMQRLQRIIGGSSHQENFVSKVMDANIVPDLCSVHVLEHRVISELLLDIAWLLQRSLSGGREANLTSVHIQRLLCVVRLLIQHRSVSILEKILKSLKAIMDKNGYPEDREVEPDLSLLQECIAHAREMVNEKLEFDNNSELFLINSVDIGRPCHRPISVEGDDDSNSATTTACDEVEESDTLLSNRIAKKQKCFPSSIQGFKWFENGCGRTPPRIIRKAHLAILLMATVALCFGICMTVVHPHKAVEFTISVGKCVFGSFKP